MLGRGEGGEWPADIYNLGWVGRSGRGRVKKVVPNDIDLFVFPAAEEGLKLRVNFSSADYIDVTKEMEREVEKDVKRGEAVLPVQSKITLDGCFGKYLEEEKMEVGNYLDCQGDCQNRVACSKKLDFRVLPDVLILHLTRYGHKKAIMPSEYTPRKITDLVDFPIVNLDLTGYMKEPVNPEHSYIYDLYAVAEHIGETPTGGHYVTKAQNMYDGNWYEYDDSKVTQIPQEQLKETVVTPKAYVLFYKRRKAGGTGNGSRG